MGDYIGDPYPYANFHHDTITPFCLQICEYAHQYIVDACAKMEQQQLNYLQLNQNSFRT